MRDPPHGERRLVSVLVTDVVDSTAIGERLGPERSKFLFDELAGLVEAEVLRFGGTVAQHTGDGVLALFGAPVAHEDDAVRAVRAACAVQGAFAAYGRDVEGAYGIGLAGRVAVNSGPVVVLAEDAPADLVYNALGDTVNVAARLQGHAGPGGVVVGPLTARQVEAQFELEPLGELALKGKMEPVSAFLVTGARDTTPIPAGSALVGRDAELATLERLFDQLKAGSGAIVSITGEAGIGKSRLIGELRRRHGGEVRFLEGSGVAYAEAIPYWPVREALRDWLGLGASESEARARLELRTQLAATLGDRADAAHPFLATLLGVSPGREGEERLRDLSGDSVQLQTFEAVRELLLSLARGRPVCLVLDDLHWVDEATLELVEEVLEVVDDEAVMIVLLYRSERERAAWRLGERARQRFPHRHTELELRALDPEASHSLAVGTAGGEIPVDVSELLAERSGGNPFFLEQALRDLVERGALLRENGGFVLARGVDVAVPSLVQEALQARLDRLAPGARELVGVASVAGRTFATPLLERIAPGLALRPLLADLQRVELVVEERRRPVPEYRFRHGLVREVAYASLLDERRRDLHRATGEALELLHVDAPQEVYGLLGYHFAAADVPEKAGRYLVAAADAARAVDANEEAVSLYERAVPFLERDGNAQGARDALLKLGLTHHLAFDFVRANAAYAAAFAHPPNRQKPPGEAERLETATQSTFRSRRNVIPGLAYEDYSEWIAAHLFRGLLRLDEHLNVVPETAAAFEVSPDGKCYRFRIDPAARWSDGTPVTAGDFAYTWARMRADGVETAFLLEILDRVEAVDDATLEVELHEPRSYALYLFAFPSFFPWPRHVCERLGAEWYLADPLVGNGPYLLAELDDEHTLLRASPAWHGPRGNVAEARIRFGSWDDPIRLWRSGELDTAFVPTAELDEATRVFTAPGLVTRYVGFVARRPPLDDQRVRRALAHALDRGALFGDEPDYDPALEGSGLIPPGLPAHSHDIALPYDPPRARELLAEAGFPDGHGLRPLRLAFIAGRRQDWLEAIAGQSAEIGVAIELQAVPGDSLDGAFEHGDVDLWWQGWTADYPDPEGSLTVLDASPAIKRDGPLDELLARARSSRDRDERWRLYREADRRLVQELVSIVPLWHPSEYRMAARPWIEGVRFGPLRLPLLDELTVTPH